MRSEALKGHLDMLLLAVLRDAPAHGYVVVERLREASGGEFGLPEGTIYPALHRLERGRLLASRREVVSGRTRRIYRVTKTGERALAGHAEEWHRFAAGVTRTLGAES